MQTYGVIHFYFARRMGAKCCDEFVSLSVCLFVCSFTYLINYMAEIQQFFMHVHCVMPCFSSGSVTIRYVLPVLRMVSCFHTLNVWRVICIAKWREHDSLNYCVPSTSLDGEK